MKSMVSREQNLVWAFVLLTVLLNIFALPEMIQTWGLLIVCQVCFLILSRHLPKLIIYVAWGMVVGFLLTHGMFGMAESSYKVRSASLWQLAIYGIFVMSLMGRDKEGKNDLGDVFMFATPLYLAAEIMVLLYLDAYVAIGIGCVLQIVVYLCFIYQPSQNHVNGGFSWAAMSLVFSLILSTGLYFGKSHLDEINHASIGNLPSISTSNKAVVKIDYIQLGETGLPPPKIYLQQSEKYSLPTVNGEWYELTTTALLLGQQTEGKDSSLAIRKFMMEEYRSTLREGVADPFHYTMQTHKGQWMDSADFNFPGIADIRPPRAAMGNIFVHMAWRDYKDVELDGFTDRLMAMYLSIPDASKLNEWANGGNPQVSLEGAKKYYPKTWAMVQQWKSEGLSNEEFIDRTLNYFRENLAYNFDHQSMEPEKNNLDWFMFEDKKGVCRHFSNAFALIMRMGGIPSRIRGGYHGGELHNKDGRFFSVLRKRDAHAWTEIWIEDQGWVLIDPTSVVPVEKGVPEDNSLKALLFGGFEPSYLPDTFSTAGHGGQKGGPRENGVAKMMDKLIGENKLSMINGKPFVYVLGGFCLLVLIWAIYKQRNLDDPRQKQWDKLIDLLNKRGVDTLNSDGPRTISQRVAKVMDPQVAKEFEELAMEFEAWKFGGIDNADTICKIKKLGDTIRSLPKPKKLKHESD